MVFKTISGIIGGLGLFIYGMQQMSHGLQATAGDRLKGIMESLTESRVKAILVGALTTAIIQSSSVTTTILVGFVNAGILSFVQAVGVIMGANIGTTITAQLIALKIDKLALPAIGIGFGIYFLAKRTRTKNIGLILLGFGMLFLGLNIMKETVKFLRTSPWLTETLLSLSDHPIYGVLAGIIVTVSVQSSSASIGLLLSLAAGGLLSIDAAIPILLGDNIGTCITALLASIGTNTSAKRTAMAHVLFNVIGTVIVLLLLPLYKKIILLTATDISHQIANAHTLFNVLNTLLFFPFVHYLILAVEKIVKKGDDDEEKRTNLDERLLVTPVLAQEQVKNEIDYIGRTVTKMYDWSFRILTEKKFELEKKVLKKESVVDLLQKEITHYLVLLSKGELTTHQSQVYSAYMHMVGDLERIGDHAENLSKLAMRIIDSNQPLTEDAMKEISELNSLTRNFLQKALNALAAGSPMDLNEANSCEDSIDNMVHRMKKRHIERLNKDQCSVYAGLIFMDLLHNYEKIGDHTLNICQRAHEL